MTNIRSRQPIAKICKCCGEEYTTTRVPFDEHFEPSYACISYLRKRIEKLEALQEIDSPLLEKD